MAETLECGATVETRDGECGTREDPDDIELREGVLFPIPTFPFPLRMTEGVLLRRGAEREVSCLPRCSRASLRWPEMPTWSVPPER